MKEIICPNCGKAFTIDEGQFAEIKSQIKEEIIEKEVAAREKALLDKFKAEYELKENKGASKLKDLEAQIEQLKKDKESAVALALSKQEAEIAKLQGDLKNASQAADLKVKDAVAKEVAKYNELNNAKTKLEGDLVNKEKEKAVEMQKLKDKYELDLKIKDDEIARVKDAKARLSTKAIGESLEQYCHDEFDKIRAYAYPYAYFEKDNEVVDGTKGDFVFRNKDSLEGTEYLSILFEMKNESDETKTKHKNEDFFKKLDDDRKKKGCDYAVLVSMLEQDSELYNSGIVDVSYRYPNMYVIRPQFFLPIIGLLDGASKKNAYALAKIQEEAQRNIDVTNFEQNLMEFKEGFEKNYNTAVGQFNTAIEEIDKTIKHLNSVKENLMKSNNNLRLANDKAQGLTIKKLTKNSPTVRAKFEALDAENKDD